MKDIKMNNIIKIDIISDVVCPWCVIGYKRLQKAIAELELEDKVKIQWQPFELNPDMDKEGENIIEHMNYKYGMKAEQVKTYQEDRKKAGEELDFVFDAYDEMKIVNTRDCHILLEYAQKFGKQNELQMRLFAAHFSERKNISDRSILEDEIKAIGLDSIEAMAILDGDERNSIYEKEDSWRKKGISAVPTMVFNDTMMMNGAYPIETYKNVLMDLINKKEL